MVKKRTTAKPDQHATQVRAAILLFCDGRSADEVRDLIRGRFAESTVGKIIARAVTSIRAAAAVEINEQMGKAILRLDRIYAAAITDDDQHLALRTQQEINRLHGLYDHKPESEIVSGGGEAVEELELIRQYVAPLHLAGDDYPVSECVRIACQIVRKTHKR